MERHDLSFALGSLISQSVHNALAWAGLATGSLDGRLQLFPTGDQDMHCGGRINSSLSACREGERRVRGMRMFSVWAMRILMVPLTENKWHSEGESVLGLMSGGVVDFL